MSAQPTQRERAFALLLTAAALAGAALLALRAPGLGDYPRDAGPAIAAGARGGLSGFFAHQPAMGAFSLYLRVPFAAIAVGLGDGSLGIYRWGSLPCLIALALVALWLARAARRRGTGALGQVLIVAICLLNPLINDALYYGHPEEILTAALLVGAMLAATEQRVWTTAVLAGLAIASKQWALVALAPAVFILGRSRLRAAIGALGVAAIVTLPMVLGNFGAFRHALGYISHAQPVVTLFTWLYPFSPAGISRLTDVTGETHTLMAHKVWGFESTLSHPLIILLGLAIPVLVCWRHERAAAPREMLLAAALVLLVRCAIDPESAAYYHLPLLLTLVALDTLDGRRLPRAGLAGTAAAFVVLDRFPAYLSPGLANAAYVAITVAGAALLVAALRGTPTPVLMRRGAQPITAA